MKCLLCWLTVCLAWAGGAVQAQDRAAAKANSELPKVLYIVPWKKAVQTEATERPLTSTVINEDREPIDRDVFRRQMQYQSQQLAQQQAKPAAQQPNTPQQAPAARP